MSRRRHILEKPWYPTVGMRKKTSWLPRGIKAGWRTDSPKGTLLYGWDLTSDTRQLWEVVATGEDGEAEFVGFVCCEREGI